MDEVDRRLRDAGERWRVAEPPAPALDPSMLGAAQSRPGAALFASFGAGAAAAALVIGVGWLAAQLGTWGGAGARGLGAGAGEPSAPSSSAVEASCAVTRPDPPFVAPPPYPATAPYGLSWFGSESLWTMLDPEGEVWEFPNGPDHLGEKTFWWSMDWPGAADEPQPGITVVGTRLDGTATFTAGPGTNAQHPDFGEAMLVGVAIPSPGCWQLTASYRDAVLSFVIWIADDN